MGPSRRDRCALWIAKNSFATQGREASEGVMVAPWSGVNVGARGQDAGHLSLLV